MSKIQVLLISLLLSSSAGATTLAVGDSITFGVSSPPSGPGYVELLQQSHALTNLGCGGASAYNWLPATGPMPCLGRFENESIDYWDELILPNLPTSQLALMLGTNEAGMGTPDWLYRATMDQLLDALLSEGVPDIILMTPPPHQDPARAALLEAYAGSVRVLCAGHEGVRCGPDIHGLLDPELDFAPGDSHPNAQGHVKIAEALEPHLLPEPSTWLMVATGLMLLAGLKR